MNKALVKAYHEHGLKVKKNLAERQVLHDLMESSPEFAQIEAARALKDIIYFFDYHAWTHEPRSLYLQLYGLSSPTLPFLTYGFQEDVILDIVNKIQSGRDVLIEKSRDMGVSWLVITIFLWFWLQKTGGNDFLIGSRKADFVDKKGAIDTLFQKFRYNLYGIHNAFDPKGFKGDRNDNVNLIFNPETGSFIRGESNNANFGTSGRYKASLMDEFSKWEDTDAPAWTSMGDSTPSRIPVSTPWGLGRKFAQLRHSGAIDVITLHWSRHPLKNIGLYYDENGKPRSHWYDDECERRKDDLKTNIGQELDIDYLTSGTPFFDNMQCSKRYIHMTDNPAKVTRYEFERTGPNKIRMFEKETGRIFIAEKPDEYYKLYDYRYIISVDVAEGLEKSDNSVFYVYDRVKRTDVAWFIGTPDTDVLSVLLYYFAKWYDGAWIAVESNNHGHAVIQRLKPLYKNLMYEIDFTKNVNYEKVKIGWATNQVTRPIMCSDLREAIVQKVDGILDPDFWLEAKTFVYNKNGKPEGSGSSLDDRVMTQAIKIQCHKWLPAPKTIVKRPREYYKKRDYAEVGGGKDFRRRKKPKGVV